jgi:hypothetical protein
MQVLAMVGAKPLRRSSRPYQTASPRRLTRPGSDCCDYGI